MPRSLLATLTLGLLSVLPVVPARANMLDRDRDPVVLTGSALPGLIGALPGRIVAFRRAGTWVPIPVQVDERAVVDFGTIYNNPALSGFAVLTYTDPLTWTGVDPDAAFDANDELVFMANEAGDLWTTEPEPAGTLAGSGVVVTITNPINGAIGYVYLFQSDGSLDPGPGPDPVSNTFYLLPSGATYLSQYNTSSGPNPENTVIASASYSVHFADRWICNEMHLTAGGATGVDILDGRKARYAPGACTRSERTFSDGEGAFIVNRQGPVRALRGYCGANSGPTTYRIHAFYEAREDVVTVLRVHPIPSLMDFFDYAPAATGMIYRNDLNLAGVTIDGAPDAVTPGPIRWEMVTGAQGTLVMTGLIHTDIPAFSPTSYYQDASPAPNPQCSGDNSEYGASGLRITSALPNTDPALGAYNVLEATRVIAYDGPGKDVAFAEARALEAQTPFAASVAPYTPTVAVEDADAPEFRLAIGPQPLRFQARVSFALPAAGAFSLRIYDVAGRVVSTLAFGRWPAGRHELAWSAAALEAGVYFARARLEGHGERALRLVVAR